MEGQDKAKSGFPSTECGVMWDTGEHFLAVRVHRVRPHPWQCFRAVWSYLCGGSSVPRGRLHAEPLRHPPAVP